jgi:hypothetical protein
MAKFREIGGKVEVHVDGWLSYGDGWLSWLRACLHGSSLGSNPDISLKYKMGDINNGVANTHTLARQKNIHKKSCKEAGANR